jgi:hypothetical protein
VTGPEAVTMIGAGMALVVAVWLIINGGQP